MLPRESPIGDPILLLLKPPPPPPSSSLPLRDLMLVTTIPYLLSLAFHIVSSIMPFSQYVLSAVVLCALGHAGTTVVADSFPVFSRDVTDTNSTTSPTAPLGPGDFGLPENNVELQTSHWWAWGQQNQCKL
ncbi:hypothetical protein F5Y18DRAFT_217888 [Xylariaceae sp. FL1019]|nr:hypothetical protein F5Y18DRAFT_217888 [Xylariaceae sp. FL1019]